MAAWCSSLVALPVTTTASVGPSATTTDETAYAADVSNSDLLHGLVGTGGVWNGGGATPAGLNDGNAGGDFEAVGGSALGGTAWAADGNNVSFREFSLSSSSGGSGYDITRIRSIAAWNSAGFGNQRYSVSVRFVGSSIFTLLATVDFQPFPNQSSAGGSTKVELSDTTGILASGVDAIRFDILDTLSNDIGGVVMREMDVFGSPTADTTPAVISSLNPADGANGVSPNTKLVATFNENIALGTGTITLRNLDSQTDTVITLPSTQVSVSGKLLTINPTSNLTTGANYAIRIAGTAITDLSGLFFPGIDNDGTWNFLTTTTPLRIMCLGDSITAGYTDNPSWANHPFEFGYRSGLCTLLTNAGYNFLFVGGSTEPFTGISGDPTNGGTYKPAFDLRDIGQDGHRGYGGQSVGFLNTNILDWLATDNPDIILLKIGTNSQNQSGLNTLVNTITSTKPDVHLIIAQIMPKFSYQAGIVNYNTYIRDTLVPNYQAQGKKVTQADQYAPFLTNPAVLTSIDTSLFSNGINHPDNDGYDKMAQVWFNRIEALGVGPFSFSEWISDPAFGIDPSKRGFGDDPDGDGIKNGIEAWFGTHPGISSGGITEISSVGLTTTFKHSRNLNPPDGIIGYYEWSPNLLDWYQGDGADGPLGGVRIVILAQNNGSITSVSATASERMSSCFLRAGVKETP